MKVTSYFISKIFLILPCCYTFALTIPEPEDIPTSTELTTEIIQTDSPYEATVPQYVLPVYYYAAAPDSFYHLPESASIAPRTMETSLSEEVVESRTISFLLNFIILPKLIMKLAKAVAFGVSAATSIGMFVFLLSATVCTFTPICILGLAIPGLRNAERSRRNFVHQIYEHIPGEKIEAGE